MRAWCGSLLLLCVPFLAAAQGNETAEGVPENVAASAAVAATEVVFDFQPSSAARKPYEIKVEPDGHGTLRYLDSAETPSQALTVSEPTLALLNKAVSTVSSGGCETRQKHIAQTGKKTISYALGPSMASCSFNYSDDQDVNAAASTFLAIQQTVEMGAELARLHRFDRLGLDAEMEALQKAVETRFAVEVGNIAPVLESIAHDDRVMERVRRKAVRLLEDAGVATAVED